MTQYLPLTRKAIGGLILTHIGSFLFGAGVVMLVYSFSLGCFYG